MDQLSVPSFQGAPAFFTGSAPKFHTSDSIEHNCAGPAFYSGADEAMQALAAALQEAETYCRSLDSVRDTFAWSSTLRAELLEREYHAGSRTLSDFRRDAERLAAGVVTLETLKKQHRVGIVALDLSGLIAEMLPASAQRQREVRRLLPQLAAARHQTLMDHIESVRWPLHSCFTAEIHFNQES
jgi:hypothetical protein